MNPLFRTIGNVPVSTDVLANLLHGYQSPNMKISAMVEKGELLRLKRGLFVAVEDSSNKPICKELVANRIYGPSYVTGHYVLSNLGMIPEAVFTLTSATTRRSRMVETPLGWFAYRSVPDAYFPIGIRQQTDAGVCYLIATPEKALCDLLMATTKIPQHSLKAVWQLLEDDLRMDMDLLAELNPAIIEQCAEVGPKKELLNNVAKIIRR